MSDEHKLVTLLEQIVALRDEKERLSAETTRINKELDELDRRAVEQMALAGLDGVRAAVKSWYRREFFSVSVPPGNRERVVEIAREACPEYVAVNTAQLKSWLKEERDRRGAGGDSLAAGTPFEGLVEEYREVRLAHRAVG